MTDAEFGLLLVRWFYGIFGIILVVEGVMFLVYGRDGWKK